MSKDEEDFSGCLYKKGDRVIPSNLDKDNPNVTVWQIDSVSKNHGGPGRHYYCLSAPGFGHIFLYEHRIQVTDRPLSNCLSKSTPRALMRVDQIGCKCAGCRSGYSKPLDKLTDKELIIAIVGYLEDATAGELVMLIRDAVPEFGTGTKIKFEVTTI